MSDDEYTLEDYIEYHRQPGIKMVAISDFNEILGSNIEENPEVEQVLYKLRQQFGPNELIPPLALTAAQKLKKAAAAAAKKNKKDKKSKSKLSKIAGKIKGASASAGKSAVSGGKAAGTAIKRGGKNLWKAGKKALKERAKQKAKDSIGVHEAALKTRESKLAQDIEKLKRKAEKGSMISVPGVGKKGLKGLRKQIVKDCKALDQDHPVCKSRDPKTGKLKKYSEMSTSLEDELIEDEYEETCDKCGEVTSLCDHEFEDQLEEVSIEDAQTLQHLVAFKSKCTNVRERMMKGKGRYIEQLKAYLNGDDNAEVRMFTGKKVKVSSLNPNKESLKSLFKSFPSGPHIVECD